MNVDDILKLDFIEENIGNASIYKQLIEHTDAIRWSGDDWLTARMLYFNLVNQEQPWLWDIYKNKCNFDILSTFNMINSTLLKSNHIYS